MMIRVMESFVIILIIVGIHDILLSLSWWQSTLGGGIISTVIGLIIFVVMQFIDRD